MPALREYSKHPGTVTPDKAASANGCGGRIVVPPSGSNASEALKAPTFSSTRTYVKAAVIASIIILTVGGALFLLMNMRVGGWRLKPFSQAQSTEPEPCT